MKAGFIGLGHLGKAMATRLMAEGVELQVWNRTTEKAAGMGATVGESPAVVVSGCEVIFLNLFDSKAVDQVFLQEGGILQGTCCDRVIVDTTTNHPADVRAFHDIIRKEGGVYLEAPVIGSVMPALQGNLIMLVSGDQTGFDKAVPFAEKLCKRMHYLGSEPGVATRMKLVNNLALAGFMAALGEAFALGDRAGVPRETVLTVLGEGGGNSGLLNVKKDKLLANDFTPQFTSEAILKDLGYMQDLARELHMPLPLTGEVSELYSRAVKAGFGDRDFSSIYSYFMKASG